MTYATIHFIRFVILTAIILVSFILFTPTTHAYFTTKQEAIALDNHSALFMIDYSFGVEKHELHLPFKTNTGTDKISSELSYTILDENNTSVLGKAVGLVLSPALLNTEGMYTVPKNTAKKFSLFVVFIPKIPVEGMQYRLQVTHLPFDFDGTQQLELNPSELKYYTTELTSF